MYHVSSAFLPLSETSSLTYFSNKGSIVPAGIWIQVETKIEIVCACLPTLPPLFRRMRSKLSGAGSSEHIASSGEKAGANVAAADAGSGDASPIVGSKQRKQKG